MGLGELLLTNLCVIAGLMFCTWLLSLLLRDVSIVDFVWGAGFVVVGWVTFANSAGSTVGSPTLQKWLIVWLTTLWGLRLSGYLFWRNHGKPEDYRYQEMRDKHGSRFPLRSLWTVFGLQGAIMWLVSLPIQTGQLAGNQSPVGPMTFAGIAIWLAGFCFESIGDFQLARFKANPENRGQVMESGLWRYTRHPNYFGDFLVWWGLYFVSFGKGTAWWSAIGPIVMSILLFYVSGVSLLEKSLKKHKPGYDAYIRRTSSFFPLPPKR